MNDILDKIYVNRRECISHTDLRGLCYEFFNEMVGNPNIDIAVIAFGTFLELMQFHPTIGERWLTITSTHNLFSLLLVNNKTIDQSSTSYQTFGTMIVPSMNHDSKLNFLCLCCYRWFGCEDENTLNENGMVYKHPIYQRVDRVIDKYFKEETVDIEDHNQIYTIFWSMANEFYTGANDTNVNVQGIVYGFYITFYALKSLCNPSIGDNKAKIVKIMNSYIKSLLKYEQFVRIMKTEMQYTYGKYAI